MSKFERKNFFHSHKNTLNFLDKFKINIETVNSTGYLETLNLNLPTILIFDKQYCRVRKTAKKYFLLLEKANILFKNPKNAAKFINKNYKSIDNWWNSKKVQNAIKIFTNKFAKKTNDPYTFLKKLKNMIKNFIIEIYSILKDIALFASYSHKVPISLTFNKLPYQKLRIIIDNFFTKTYQKNFKKTFSRQKEKL